MIKFHFIGSKQSVTWSIGLAPCPEFYPHPTAGPGISHVIVDGAEKKMLARAGVRFPKVHGPVTLSEQASQMVAWNFPAITAKYGKAPSANMVANDDEPEDLSGDE